MRYESTEAYRVQANRIAAIYKQNGNPNPARTLISGMRTVHSFYSL